MLYEIAKAAHILSMIVWISGMTVAAMSLRHSGNDVLPMIKSFDRSVTTPAMLLTWGFGILLGVQGGWFGSGWLWAKLMLVIGLSGLHGMITGRLRKRISQKNPEPDQIMQRILPIGLLLTAVVVLLVTTKAI